jgi:hypothetical protein
LHQDIPIVLSIRIIAKIFAERRYIRPPFSSEIMVLRGERYPFGPLPSSNRQVDFQPLAVDLRA